MSGTPGTTPQTGPHVVHFSAVKEVVEIESGRFEFFKQMLTVGLGGIAGLAAIFTEPDKIPDEPWSRGAIAAFALSSIIVVIWSGMGISAYANHLRDVHKLSEDPTSQDLLDKRAESERGILSHARVALLASGVAALSLVLFAGLKLFHPVETGPKAAMELASRTLTQQPGNPVATALEHFQTVGTDYLITYTTSQNQTRFTFRIDRDKNSVKEITTP